MADLNPTAAEFPNMQPLTEVELDVVHCFSAKNYEPSKNVEMSWADPTLGITLKMVSVAAGADLSKKLLCLALRHYDLASTTVTGFSFVFDGYSIQNNAGGMKRRKHNVKRLKGGPQKG